VVTSTDFTNLATETISTAGNIQKIEIVNGQVATYLGSQLTGQAISINRDAAGASPVTLDVNIVGSTAVNLSPLTFAATGGSTAFVGGIDIVDIDGDTANNVITGPSISSDINGGSGNDTLTGAGGADTITGGVGVDVMAGGTSVGDRFNYVDLSTLAAQTGITIETSDLITDFDGVWGDRISTGLSGIPGTNYAESAAQVDFGAALAAANASMNGTIIYYLTQSTADANVGLLFIDTDAVPDGSANAVIRLTGVNSTSFEASYITG
jgi:Ca2+-binding RTX toxin-like protein